MGGFELLQCAWATVGIYLEVGCEDCGVHVDDGRRWLFILEVVCQILQGLFVDGGTEKSWGWDGFEVGGAWLRWWVLWNFAG